MRVLFFLVFFVATVRAHTAPVDPATCVFEPLGLEQPGGSSASVAAATPLDTMRLVFSVASSAATICHADPGMPFERCAGTAVPRAFTVGALPGSLAFPASFRADLFGTGDVQAAAVTLAVTIDGITATPVAALTTGLAHDGTTFAEGAPFDGLGVMTLVGVVAAGTLPPPFDTAATIVRARCGATPAPDLDQFRTPLVASKLAGTLSTGTANVKALVRVTDDTMGDLATLPIVARVSIGGFTIATGAPTLVRKGRRLPASYKLTMAVADAVLPPIEGAAADVQLTLDVDGIPARTVRSFKLRGGGTKLKRR